MKDFHLYRYWRLLLMAALLSACSEENAIQASPEDSTIPEPQAAQPIDAHASGATRALLNNLHKLKGNGVMFGHQDTLAYGVQWYGDTERSDVRDLTGDFPAVYGWEIGNLELGADANLDGVSFDSMQTWMKNAYQRGGIITVSWHMSHPLTREPAWETEPGAEALLPGGESHDELKAYLDSFAEFVAGLAVETAAGTAEPLPIIFRPWHEHNGDWFWWGKRHTSEEQYVALWRFTVEYLRDQKQLHNLLYAISPDRSRTRIDSFQSDYLYGYPGDEYVDILGLDNYWDLGHSGNETPRVQAQEHFVASLTGLADLAEQKGKVAAMTEGGQDTLSDADFWTQRLLAGLTANDKTRQIVYSLVWRNANREREERDHFYVPYPGHLGEEDFVEFYQHPATLFESDLPDMYRED